MKPINTLFGSRRHKMIALPDVVKYNALKRKYIKLSSFIRSIYNHTEGEDLSEYDVCKKEMQTLSKRLDEITLEMDAFEQNELGMK